MNIKEGLKLFFEQHSLGLSKLKGIDVYHYIKNNFKPSLPTSISWHIESQELQGIENEYDQGWYDCLKMIARYFEE